MSAIESAARKAAMAALERGVKAGCEYMTDLLKMTVSGPGAITIQHGAKPSIQYRRDTERGGKWEKSPKKWKGASRVRDIPPGRVSGAALDSICYKIIERDFNAGTIRVIVGVDGSAPGGMLVSNPYVFAPSYLLGHEYGIRYPTRGPMKGTGPVVQRPWLRSTVKRYWDSFTNIVSSVSAEK